MLFPLARHLTRQRRVSTIRTAYNGATRNWLMLPSGSRWVELKAGGEADSFEVQEGQVVRVDYTARLDDGKEISRATASFKLGSNSSAVCEAVNEVTTGMRLGDVRRCVLARHALAHTKISPACGVVCGLTRLSRVCICRVRAPPSSRKNPRVLVNAPPGEMLEYDVVRACVCSIPLEINIHDDDDVMCRALLPALLRARRS